MPERSPTSALKMPFKEAEGDPLPIIQHAADTKVSNETEGVQIGIDQRDETRIRPYAHAGQKGGATPTWHRVLD